MTKAIELHNKLTKRLLLYILLCSVCVSLCSTLLQLYSSFQNDITLLEQRFENIEKSHIPSIASSLWDFNKVLTAQQIQGIVDLPDIGFVKIENDFDYYQQFGDESIEAKKFVEYPIIYNDKKVGKLQIYANYQDIYKRLRQQAGFILTAEFIKIFIVAFFIIIIVNRLITRHLFKITHYAQQLSPDNLDDELTLSNRPQDRDELDSLVSAVNNMRVKLKNDVIKLENAENALLALNGELEVKVHDRTAKVEESNKQLQQSLDDLTLAKDQLVQSEKMASLGQLVAGVAHEVNTPLGICVTSISALKENVEGLQEAVEKQKLSKSYLKNTLNLLSEYEGIIERSLKKAVDLISSFKSVAVEQHTDPEVNINLHKHVYDVVNTVKTLFKSKRYVISINLDESLNLVTYPSAWNQIITNLLMNSHIHGFEGNKEGNISIAFTQSEGYLTLVYGDDGIGIPKELRKRIFDPFVTTKRGQGGSGLGLNIVFNLVNTKLQGNISLLDSEQGTYFEVKVPIVNTNESELLTDKTA